MAKVDDTLLSSSKNYSIGKWKLLTLVAFLLLGVTQISMEQWHQLMPVDSIQKEELKWDAFADRKKNSTQPLAKNVRTTTAPVGSHNFNGDKKYKRNSGLLEKTLDKTADGEDDTARISQSSIDFIREHFPECISESGMIDLKSRGSYVPVLPGVQPRYDHHSCFLMKARYNCAHPPDYDKPEASDYELVLRLNNNTKPCRLRSLVDALGGPVGLAQRPNPTTGTKQSSPTRIAFHGSSYVRQMWEAMTCGFRQDITQLMVKKSGPDVSLAAMERRNNMPIEFSEIGKPIRSTRWIQHGRCHGVYKNELADYYHKSAPRIPSDTIDGCNDSIAMARLQNSVEVYYVFRPNDYSADAFSRIYSDFFRLAPSKKNNTSESIITEFDALIWNVGLEKPENIFPEGIRSKQEIGVDSWLPTLMSMQRRDLGVYFGADNPWITKPPDGHPCLPGIPDDEVNLILYIMYTGYTVK